MPFKLREEWKRCMQECRDRAIWIARATVLANNLPHFPFSDSGSSRASADKMKAEKLKRKELGSKKHAKTAFARPVELGGHTLVPIETNGEAVGWRCTTCRARSVLWEKLAPMKCDGSKAEEWARRAVKAAEDEQLIGAGHRRAISGVVIWCQVCGCYSDSRVRGLTDYCKGKPNDRSGGGRAGQLLYLRNNIHPRTRKPLPPPTDEDGTDLGGRHRYRELELKRDRRSNRSVDEGGGMGRQTTEPGGGSDLGSAGNRIVGKTAAGKHRERLDRVRAKEVANKASVITRRLRGKQRPGTSGQEPGGGCPNWHGMW